MLVSDREGQRAGHPGHVLVLPPPEHQADKAIENIVHLLHAA